MSDVAAVTCASTQQMTYVLQKGAVLPHRFDHLARHCLGTACARGGGQVKRGTSDMRARGADWLGLANCAVPARFKFRRQPRLCARLMKAASCNLTHPARLRSSSRRTKPLRPMKMGVKVRRWRTGIDCDRLVLTHVELPTPALCVS